MKEIATILWFTSASFMLMAYHFFSSFPRPRELDFFLVLGPVIALMSVLGIISALRNEEPTRFKVLPCLLGTILALYSIALVMYILVG